GTPAARHPRMVVVGRLGGRGRHALSGYARRRYRAAPGTTPAVLAWWPAMALRSFHRGDRRILRPRAARNLRLHPVLRERLGQSIRRRVCLVDQPYRRRGYWRRAGPDVAPHDAGGEVAFEPRPRAVPPPAPQAPTRP